MTTRELYNATVRTWDRFQTLRASKGAYHPETVRAFEEYKAARKRFERGAQGLKRSSR